MFLGNLSGFGDLLAAPTNTRKALDFDAIKHASQGRWTQTIFPAVGISLRGNGRQHQPCPLCGGSDRFRCDDMRGEGTWICSQCGSGNGFLLVQRYTQLDAYETNKLIADCVGYDSSVAISDEQRDNWQAQQVKRDAVEEEAKEQARYDASLRAKSIYGNADAVTTHAYLESKGVTLEAASSIRQDKANRLVIPMYYNGQGLVNIQTIDNEGTKLFLGGGRVKGAYHVIFNSQTKDEGVIILCEGYATAATVFMSLQGLYPVFVAFNANNMPSVASSIREQHPKHRIIVCADDDSSTALQLHSQANPESKKSLEEYNAGIREGKNAAEAVGGQFIVPKFKLEENINANG